MNILFFLTPKEDVAYIYDTYSLRQVLEKMEYHKYSCIPIITERGKYAGTITHPFVWIPIWKIFWKKQCSRILFRLWMIRKIL